MLEVRFLNNNDYKTLDKWWLANRFGKVQIDQLPMVNGVIQGLMVYDGDVEICAGFIIETTVQKGVLVEYIVSNFEVKDRELRKESLNYLIKKLMQVCKDLGKNYIYTSLKNPGLIERLKDCGFKICSQGTVEMIGVL